MRLLLGWQFQGQFPALGGPLASLFLILYGRPLGYVDGPNYPPTS
jgi:hypothetical protein